MTWKCWLAIGACALVLGVIIGVLLKRNSDDKALLEMLYDQIAEIREEADMHRDMAQDHMAIANRLANQLQAAKIKQSREKYKAIEEKPATLPKCMEGLAVASGHVVLLEHGLAMSRAETIELRKALYQKEQESEALRKALDLSKESVDLTIKHAKKQKRNSIIGTTLACTAAAVGMYGIGTLR